MMNRRYGHSRAEFTCTILWMFFSHLIFDVSDATDRGGWLFFKETGRGDKTLDEWYCTTCSDSTDLDRYIWDMEYIIGNTEVFRSPLIEHWDSMNMQKISFVLFNANGETLDKFDFILTDPNASMDNFIEYLVHTPIAAASGDLDFGLSLTITHPEFYDQILLNILAINEQGVIGEKFILGTDYSGNGFAQFPDEVYEDCYEASSLSADTEVEDVLQCVYYCLGSGEHHIGLHSETNGTNNSTYCRCLGSVHQNTAQGCGHHCTDSTDDCGELVDLRVLQGYGIGLSVYSINNVRDYLSTVSDLSQLSDWKEYYFRPEFDTVYSVNFGHVRFIREFILFDSIQQNFSLAVTSGDCTAGSFDTSMYRFLGEPISNIKVFTSTIHVFIEPVPAMCLFINFTDSPILKTYTLELKFVTGDFVMAHYFGVWGEWLNRECSFLESMWNSSIIPGGDINLEYTESINATSTGVAIDMTQSSTAKVHIRLPVGGGEDYWIQNIIVSTSYPVEIICNANTKTTCTDQSSGFQKNVLNNASFDTTATDNSQADLTFSTSGYMFCGQNINLKIRTPEQYMTDRNLRFSVTVEMYGCVLSKGNTSASVCNHLNLLAAAGLSKYTEITLKPLPSVAYPGLRPFGNGLLIFGSLRPTISIRLSQKHDTMLQSVTVKGDGHLHSAEFMFGGKHAMIMSDPNNRLVFDQGILRGRLLEISNFVADQTSTPFLAYIEIVVCTNYYGYFYKNKTIVTTTGPTTSTSALATSFTTPQTTSPVMVNTPPISTPMSVQTTLPTAPPGQTQLPAATTVQTPVTTAPSGPSPLPVTTTVQTPVTTAPSGPSPLPATTTVNALTTIQTSASPNLGLIGPTILPNNCCCGIVRNYTTQELDDLVKEITKNLTVSRKRTSAYKRTLISAEDDRPSATYVGTTCGTVVVSLSGVFLVFMDLDYVMAAFNFVKSAFGLFR